MSRRFLPAVLLVALAVGCAAPAEESEADGASAMAEARATTESAARTASQLAERLHRGAPAVARVPVLTDEGEAVLLPSTETRVGAWSLQSIVDADAEKGFERGFLLQPQGDAVPSGSFVIVVGDGERLAARAVFVPDEAKDAAGWAKTLLDASEADAKAYAGARSDVKIQGLGTRLAKEAWLLVAHMIPSGAEKGASALARAEARMTNDSALWKDFASHFEGKERKWSFEAMKDAVGQLRKDLGNRRVIVMDSNLKGKSCGTVGGVARGLAGCPQMVANIVKAMDEKIVDRNVALAVPIGAEISPVAMLWAFDNKVPIVLSSGGGKDPIASIRALAHRARQDGNAALADRLEAGAADPAQASLVRILDTYGLNLSGEARYPQWASASLLETHDQMTPLWALADEAFSIDAVGRGLSVFSNFLSFFQTHTRVQIPG